MIEIYSKERKAKRKAEKRIISECYKKPIEKELYITSNGKCRRYKCLEQSCKFYATKFSDNCTVLFEIPALYHVCNFYKPK